MTELAIEIREPLDLPMVQVFVGEEAADGLDDALEKLPNGATVFAWLDDLRIEGDISSKELLARCPGFVAPTGEQPWDNYFTIFVRGNVEITGVLEVNQYYDVYVRGNVRARSILSHTGNLLATGSVTADEVMAFECNEEGGLLHGASCDVPVLCHFGGGDWVVDNQNGKTIHGEVWDDPDFVALLEVLKGLGVGSTPRDAFRGVRELVRSGRINELLRALGVASRQT